MSVSKVNDAYYRKFIINHLDNKFSLEDLYDVVATLNPANDLYRIKSNAEKYADSSHKLDLKMMYEFRTESSAKLFISTYQNLVQKGKSVLKAKIKDNKVLLEFKEPMIISHKQRYNDVGEVQQKRISEALAFREESHLLSDVFIQTVDSLFSSGIYKLQASPDFVSRGNIRNTKEFIKYEAMTSKIEGRSFTALYKSTMHNNAIEMSPKLNNEVMEQITSAMNSRVDGLKGASLGKRIFRLSSKDGGLEYALQMDSKVKRMLERLNDLTNKQMVEKQQEKTLFSRFVSKIKTQPEPDPLVMERAREKVKKQLKTRYK